MPALLFGKDEEEAAHWIDEAVQAGIQFSDCEKAKRGVVVVKNGVIIGRDGNHPPPGFRCEPSYCRPICSTYCGHAELNALCKTLTNRNDPAGSAMYQARIEEGKVVDSRPPRCPDCSKYLLLLGVETFVLKHAQGYTAYTTLELHRMGLESLSSQSPK